MHHTAHQVTSATLSYGGRMMLEGLVHHAAQRLAPYRGITDVSGLVRCVPRLERPHLGQARLAHCPADDP
ncbi:hypothetical protein CP982_01185 [Streptomyces spectabilis]|uniref:Uncharacterized protein n=2 Tax=Streptomyces spectabilis TaxID=68270 RepID=A0A5P2X3D0_STRST|nr:hypothetical protein CP982_01185 [Streptomyces spectabilis]